MLGVLAVKVFALGGAVSAREEEGGEGANQPQSTSVARSGGGLLRSASPEYPGIPPESPPECPMLDRLHHGERHLSPRGTHEWLVADRTPSCLDIEAGGYRRVMYCHHVVDFKFN